MSTQPLNDDQVDAHVDCEIAECLSATDPKSFFLFAGAGSGKTRSLIKALQHVQQTMSGKLRLKGQKVAVITYTNAARDEIQSRLSFDPLIDVRTIHSFCWSLIEGLNADIRTWMVANLTAEIQELEFKEQNGRKGKASATRISKIASNLRRLDNLPNVRSFVYSPTGDNRTRDALNHGNVLKIAADFLMQKPAMRDILVGRYPVMLVDESQDTNKNLVDALFEVQDKMRSKFVLGLLGDMMQRIYFDGKEGLGSSLPADWRKPTKQMNYRCSKRVVRLINKIRAEPDHQQRAVSTAPDGVVRLFVLPSTTSDKPAAEKKIRRAMAELSNDSEWEDPEQVKSLILEHRMAAARLGFLEAFAALHGIDSWRTSLTNGTMPAFQFFYGQVLPLVKARRANDRFALARIAKKYSPLLTPALLKAKGDGREQLRLVLQSINRLCELWDEGGNPTLIQVLRLVHQEQLLDVPGLLLVHASGEISRADQPETDGEDSDPLDERVKAIENFLAVPFSQIAKMGIYLSGKAPFDTHQGVKGREFERVMVIMDDSEARGFTFKYDDLFGGRAPGEKALDITRRLFYVTCSRARKSLALVAYSSSPARTRDYAVAQEWFAEDEIVLPDLPT